MSEPKYSVLLTDEQLNDLELIRRVRQGKVKKAGRNGYIIYNAKWHNEHWDTAPREKSEWIPGECARYQCRLCQTNVGYKTPYCPMCGAIMEEEVQP